MLPVLLGAQVAINTTGSAPDESAILDISSINMGVLVPRVEIDDESSSASPILNPAEGLVVYNTGTAAVGEGLYVWSGDDVEWVAVLTSKSAIVQPFQAGVGGYNMQWGGELEARADSWAVFGGHPNHGKKKVPDYSTKGIVPINGEIKTFSWSSERADNTSVVAIVINGVTTTFPLSGPTGYAFLNPPIPVERGDVIQFKGDSGKDAFHTGFMIYIE